MRWLRGALGPLGPGLPLGLAALALLASCAADLAQEGGISIAAPSAVAAAPAPTSAPALPAEPATPTATSVAAPPPPAPLPVPSVAAAPAPSPTAPAAQPQSGSPGSPAPPSNPAAPVEITDVEVRVGAPDAALLTIRADGPVGTYESFSLPDPPRLVVDIPNATHAIKQPIRVPKEGPVLRVRSSQYREKPVKVVRLVLDLRSSMPYNLEAAANTLSVQIGSVTAGLAPPTGPPTGRVNRVDFQVVRGKPRLVIGTTGKVTFSTTEVADPPSLVIDIAGATIDPAVAKSLDLRQVAAPIQRVRSAQYKQDAENIVRVVAELRPGARYEVQQTPSAISVDLTAPRVAEVRPPAAPPAPPAPAAPVPPAPAPAAPEPSAPRVNGRISMDFKEADINNLLRIIAEVSGFNVVAGEEVKGKVTVKLVNVEWQQALDVILKINNFGYEIDGNIIRVASLTTLAREREAREKARADAARATQVVRTLEPLPPPRVISVNYAKAADVAKQLDRLKTPGRTDVGIVVDDRTNTLIVTDLPESVSKMETLLRRLDIPTPQVLIEARLIEASKTFSQSLGIEFGFGSRSFVRSGAAGVDLTPVNLFSSAVGTNIVPPVGPDFAVTPILNFPAAGISSSGLGIQIGSMATGNLRLDLRLSAAESENKIRTLSAPRIATLDNQEAEIKQGTQVPYTTVDSSGRTVVAFIDAFIRLKVTPHITNDRRISMKLEAERSFPGDRIDFAGGFAFRVETRKATTNVLASNGSTIVIGGLLQSNETVAESRVPFLSAIPFLGWLFKNHSVGPDQRNELMIFLTPTILEEAKVS